MSTFTECFGSKVPTFGQPFHQATRRTSAATSSGALGKLNIAISVRFSRCSLRTARGRSGSSKLQVHTLAAAALFSCIILKTSLVHSLLDHFPGPLLTPHTREGNTDFSFCFWVALSLIAQPEIVHDRGEGNSVAKKKDEKSSASCMESTLQQFCTMREVSKNTGKEPFSLYKVTNHVTCLKWTWHHLQGNLAVSDASKSRFWICLWLLWAWNIAST